MKHLSEEQLILYRYGEAEGSEEISRHLAACEQCRAERDALAALLSAVDIASVPERSENYGAEVWRQLEPRLLHQSVHSRRRWMPLAWPGRLGQRRKPADDPQDPVHLALFAQR